METPSLNEREQAVLNEMSDGIAYRFSALAEWTKIPADEVRAIVRSFRARGLAEYGPICSEDDYRPCGSGYWLTEAGWNLKTKMELD